MESSSLLPLPPAPPPRTTSVQSNLSKLFHFAKNNKASHLAFHSKSFNVTKGSRTAQSSTHQSSESRAIISNESQESPLERSFGEACSVATGSSGTISRAYGECSTSSNSKDSLVCTPAKVSLALKGNSPGRPGGKQSTSEHKSELKKTSSSSWTCAASSSTTSTTCSSGGNGAIASGNSAASGVAHRVAKKQSKQPRPKSDMFFANPVVKTRERPIGRSASRYSTLEVRHFYCDDKCFSRYAGARRISTSTTSGVVNSADGNPKPRRVLCAHFRDAISEGRISL